MTDDKRKRGRPPISEEMKREMVSKIEPYLKSGLSIRMSVMEAHISRATFYRLMQEDDHFRDQIDHFRNFVSVLVNNALVRELMTIVDKQRGNPEKNIQPQPLSKDDKRFLWKFVLSSNLCKEEYGRREQVSTFDPEEEIQRIRQLIEDNSSEDIQHIDE